MQRREDEQSDVEVTLRGWEHRSVSWGSIEGAAGKCPIGLCSLFGREKFVVFRTEIEQGDVHIVWPGTSDPSSVDERAKDIGVVCIDISAPDGPATHDFLATITVEVVLRDTHGECAIFLALEIWERTWGAHVAKAIVIRRLRDGDDG